MFLHELFVQIKGRLDGRAGIGWRHMRATADVFQNAFDEAEAIAIHRVVCVLEKPCPSSVKTIIPISSD